MRDPTIPEDKRGAALLGFDISKRPYHLYAQSFNYFQERNTAQIGYQVEAYPDRLKLLHLDKTTVGINYRYAKQLQGYHLEQELKPFDLPSSLQS